MALRTLGAPQRRLLGRSGRRHVTVAEPAPVPTTRATVIRAEPLGNEDDGRRWLAIGVDERALEVEAAVRELNFVLRAHRAAASDPYARDVRAGDALVLRLGFGDGDQVADGRFTDAVELPRTPPKRRRGEALAPQERLAAVLAGRTPLVVGEELLLRAQLDLDAGRGREAALQARIALEALLGDLEDRFGAPLRPLREPVGRAANRALEGELGAEDSDAVAEAVAQMHAAVRRHAASTLQ